MYVFRCICLDVFVSSSCISFLFMYACECVKTACISCKVDAFSIFAERLQCYKLKVSEIGSNYILHVDWTSNVMTFIIQHINVSCPFVKCN